jgi:hypothetical protein
MGWGFVLLNYYVMHIALIKGTRSGSVKKILFLIYLVNCINKWLPTITKLTKIADYPQIIIIIKY